MKFLVDMNLSPAWVSFLTEAGFEAVHWSRVGRGGAPDREVMEWASEHGRILVTADLDFGAILAAGRRRRPSVIQLRSDLPIPESIGAKVVAAVRRTEADLVAGAIISIDAERTRLRVLPIGR